MVTPGLELKSPVSKIRRLSEIVASCAAVANPRLQPSMHTIKQTHFCLRLVVLFSGATVSFKILRTITFSEHDFLSLHKMIQTSQSANPHIRTSNNPTPAIKCILQNTGSNNLHFHCIALTHKFKFTHLSGLRTQNPRKMLRYGPSRYVMFPLPSVRY